jgi:RNA polymerase sigma-70 factor, ECF subfamily
LWCFVVSVVVNARATTPEQGSAAEMTALVAAVRLGNSQANDALWERCCVVAQRVARRWAGNGVDADDLSQEALLRAVESFDGLRNPAALHSWMQVIVTRSVARRVRIVRRKRELTAGSSDPEFLPSRDPLPDFQVDLRRLLDTLGSLPEEERRCFWLRRCEGLCIEEIARETALSPSTIHRRLNVAERRLAKRLRDPGAAVATEPSA